jgi:nuclear transcription factor Y gamma
MFVYLFVCVLQMISAEAPVLFAKAAEIFIHELTMRAWIHTEVGEARFQQIYIF